MPRVTCGPRVAGAGPGGPGGAIAVGGGAATGRGAAQAIATPRSGPRTHRALGVRREGREALAALRRSELGLFGRVRGSRRMPPHYRGRMPVLFVFVDGVGAGARDPAVNPLARADFLLSRFGDGTGAPLPRGGRAVL